MLRRAVCPLLIALSVSALGQKQPSAGTLMVGDAAPSLRVGTWIQGTPFQSFAPGQVYVVDIFATWAIPARTSIPYLSRLQKRYGARVTVLGIAAFGREPAAKTTATAKKFVAGMGARMTYAVATDTAPVHGAMADRWMTAAGQNVVPTTFVVGKDGRLAYIGNPTDEAMTATIDAILAGTYDAAGARAEARRKAEAADAMQTTFTKVSAAYKRDDDKAADAAMAALVAKYPETAGTVLSIRFDRHLDKGREAEAIALLKAEWETANLSVNDLNEFAWEVVTSKKIHNPDYPLAIAIARRGVELSKEVDPAVIDTLAYTLFASGDVDGAVLWEEKAVALTGGKDEGMVAALARYRKAKGG